MKMTLLIVAIVLVVMAAVFLLGPRETVQDFAGYDAGVLGDDPEKAIQASEAKVPDIRDGLAKEFVWRDPDSRASTPISVVYVHGFSASKSETRPLPDNVAEALGANLFLTRLKGHGRTGQAMAEVTANDWMGDMAEAAEVGRRLGDRVIVIGTSTGATLAALAATQPEMRDRIAGMVFISPNFGVQAPGADTALLPWARQLLPLILGSERSFATTNPAYEHAWTTSYPLVSLMPMVALVHHVRVRPFEGTDIPLLVLHAPDDQVVDIEQTRKVYKRWGGPKSWIDVTGTTSKSHHVLAGDIVEPAMTEPLSAAIIDWAKGL